MKTIKIVADSSADVLELEKTAFAAAPLKVITDAREFVDDARLDVDAMVSWFDSYKGRSKTSWPNSSDWLEAFGDADEVYREIDVYKRQTGLTFMLESLKNFAANGRVSPTVAKLAGVLGIRIVGKASDQGTLEPTNKCRGVEKSLAAILAHLISSGLSKGKVRIAHCMNEGAAQKLKEMIQAQMEQVDVKIHRCRGLCSYYAEKGGLLVGLEKL